MTETTRQILLEILLLDYDDLKAKLTQRLGSAELASDVLQDTWLRLEKAAAIGPVQRPRPYLLRMAHNIALKRLEGEPKTVTLDDARIAIGLADAAPGPAEIAEARAELAALKEAVHELTPRRRDILLASRLDGVPLQELAVRFGVSQRLVERELQSAVLHCAERLKKKVVQRFGPKPRPGSKSETDQ
jgi:RNA polymerase sigma-70 factor (ECF subfamily)